MERRHPRFVINQPQDNIWAQEQQRENLFIAKMGINRYEASGTITDILHIDRHYSRLYRLFRALAFGEPFQLRKNGNNVYGTSASYTVLRLNQLSGNESIDVLCCGECGFFSAGDEVTLKLSKTRSGEYVLLGGFNHRKNTYIRRDPLSISPTTLRVLALMNILVLALVIVWLTNGGISQLVYGCMAAIGWLLTTLWRAFGSIIILAIGIVVVLKSLLHK